MKKNILEKTGKVLVQLPKRCTDEVNSTCPCVYQPKLPESVEKMRKK